MSACFHCQTELGRVQYKVPGHDGAAQCRTCYVVERLNESDIRRTVAERSVLLLLADNRVMYAALQQVRDLLRAGDLNAIERVLKRVAGPPIESPLRAVGGLVDAERVPT